MIEISSQFHNSIKLYRLSNELYFSVKCHIIEIVLFTCSYKVKLLGDFLVNGPEINFRKQKRFPVSVKQRVSLVLGLIWEGKI